jgi:hypothetical protein
MMTTFLLLPPLALAANTWIYLLAVGIVAAMMFSLIVRVLRK